MRHNPLFVLLTLVFLFSAEVQAQGSPSSYATGAFDEIGSTGSASVALGVPDYFFVNDNGLGFGGTNVDTFDVGEATVLTFPLPLLNVAGQFDLIVSAFVGGLGATDNATVGVEVSSDGLNYADLGSFSTEEARVRSIERHERNFEGVKRFWIEFGVETDVTHVRLTNLSGTTEGLRLDAVEGVLPDTGRAHAFEIRFERYRVDASERFLLRLKNISSDLGGQPITGFTLEKLPINEWMEDTIHSLLASDGVGEMLCVSNCVGDADGLPGVHNATWAFSLDGLVPAAPGIGLEPGRSGAHERFRNVDIDALGTYLSGFTFWVEFADGVVIPFDFDTDVVGFGNIGARYQKYTYYSSTPSLSGPRTVHYFEYADLPTQQVPSIDAKGLVLLLLALLGIGVALARSRRPNRSPA
ncbi:MAG: hypothetical protein GY910_07355 [bacterium]|nr:hypothetical protein [Deltaproteobacteria bacterium]MCP4904781.1 hypothetical protein [bacterium]